MRALIQRVSGASVTVAGEVTGAIDAGLLVLLGIARDDSPATADRMVQRLLHYRVFSDESGRMNRSLQEVGGGLLVVSQFTLMADTAKGLRPGFSVAATPDHARAIYDYFLEEAKRQYAPQRIGSGVFGADMKVALVNDGPVTFLLELS